VIPPIFASSIILFPATLASWFGAGEGTIWLRDLAAALGPGQPVHEILYASAIIFFCFFYTALQLQPEGNGGEPEEERGIHSRLPPGRPDRKVHRGRFTLRLTIVGARSTLVVVCFIPNFLIAWKNVPFYFGGTVAADHRRGDHGLHDAGAGRT